MWSENQNIEAVRRKEDRHMVKKARELKKINRRQDKRNRKKEQEFLEESGVGW